MEVLALGHMDLTTTDLEPSTRFYALVLGALGFPRVEHPSYVAFSNGRMNVGLRQAAPGGYWRRVQTEGRDERPRYAPRQE